MPLKILGLVGKHADKSRCPMRALQFAIFMGITCFLVVAWRIVKLFHAEHKEDLDMERQRQERNSKRESGK